jgi:hypothetical protein
VDRSAATLSQGVAVDLDIVSHCSSRASTSRFW